MLRDIRICGVGCFRDNELRMGNFAKLNLISGDNGSGKTLIGKLIGSPGIELFSKSYIKWEDRTALDVFVFNENIVKKIGTPSLKSIFVLNDEVEMDRYNLNEVREEKDKMILRRKIEIEKIEVLRKEKKRIEENKEYYQRIGKYNEYATKIRENICVSLDMKAMIDKQIIGVNKRISYYLMHSTNDRPAATYMNYILKKIGLGNFSFKFGNNYRYEVLRDGKPATVFSHGESQILAFVYYLIMLQGSDDIGGVDKPRIAVIDDPTANLTGYYRDFVIEKLEELIKILFEEKHSYNTYFPLKQVFILSGDSSLLDKFESVANESIKKDGIAKEECSVKRFDLELKKNFGTNRELEENKEMVFYVPSEVHFKTMRSDY